MDENSSNLVPSQQDAEEELAIEPVGSPEELGFPAKPNAAQIRAWSNQQLWLEAFTRTGSVGAACAEVGVSVSAAERWGSVDLYGFKKRKADAGQMFLGKVEAEINRRAIEGVDHPVIYKGEITTTYREFSDNLLMFRAKRLDPSYRDNYDDRTREGTPAITQIIIHLPPGVHDGQPMVVDGAAKLVPEEHDGAEER